MRQLENTIARLAALSTGGTITLADLEQATGQRSESSVVAPLPTDDAADPPLDARNGPSLKEQVEAFERGLVARALDATGGNQSEAARRLGMDVKTIRNKLKAFGLSGDEP